MTTSNGVGIGTQGPRAGLDVTAHTRLKSHSEEVGIVTLYLTKLISILTKQQLICTVTDNVDRFRIYNPDETSQTSFTLKLTQDSTGGRNVGIATMNVGAGGTMPVYSQVVLFQALQLLQTELISIPLRYLMEQIWKVKVSSE